MKITLSLGRSCLYVALPIMVLACFFPIKAKAGGIEYQFNAPFTNTMDPDPSGSAPWVDAIFQDGTGIYSGDVFLTLTDADVTGSEFVASFYFNLNSAYDPTKLNFSLISSNNFSESPTPQKGEGSFRADGDGMYDVEIDFGANAFVADSSATWEISDSSIPNFDATNFIQLSSEGGGAGLYDAAVKIQGLSGGGSTFLYPTAEAQTYPVPEPAPAAIGSIGIGVGFVRWWLRRKRT